MSADEEEEEEKDGGFKGKGKAKRPAATGSGVGGSGSGVGAAAGNDSSGDDGDEEEDFMASTQDNEQVVELVDDSDDEGRHKHGYTVARPDSPHAGDPGLLQVCCRTMCLRMHRLDVQV